MSKAAKIVFPDPRSKTAKKASKPLLDMPTPAEAIATAKQDVERFTNMMNGLNTFCLNISEDGDEHDFAVAVSYLADSIARDAKRIAERLGKVLEGGAE